MYFLKAIDFSQKTRERRDAREHSFVDFLSKFGIFSKKFLTRRKFFVKNKFFGRKLLKLSHEVKKGKNCSSVRLFLLSKKKFQTFFQFF